ncbi:MAG TPA: hypothetical protein VKF61_07815 [Candidatus Polarisedimenticolia bacterium]|nr:hypothetical protein [Candidatus Polarisedimenticolia bacterium]
MKRMSKTAAVLLVVAALCGLGGAAQAASYSSTDLLYVAYQPHGREFIVDLGPASAFLTATGPVDVLQFSAADLAGAYGGSVPSDLQVAIFGSDGPDGYLSTRGPVSTSFIGSAIGASGQIRFLGANFANLSAPVAGNPNAGTFEFGDSRSYQATLNARNPGSLGNNVSFSVEGGLPSAPALVTFFKAKYNPFTGAPPSTSPTGSFQVRPDGTVRYLPLRSIQAACVAGPKTLNPKSQGSTFSFAVSLTDVTDPLNPQPVALSRMDPAYVSQVGAVSLPVPSSAAGCGFGDDGIWESPAARTDLGITFVDPSDGNCSTLDGNRQDILGVVGQQSGDLSICISSSVEGNPVACCDTVNVLAKARR